MKKLKPLLEKQLGKLSDLQAKAFELEHKNILKNDYDNCLICPHALIQENALGKYVSLFKRFPVVNCMKEPGRKYVVNPMKRPSWCKRK